MAVSGGEPGLQLAHVLAALEAGHAVLACNDGWWPRERDAVLERIRPGWVIGADGGLGAVAPGRTHGSHDTGAAELGTVDGETRKLWLGTAGSFGEPSPFGWDEEQLNQHWLAPDPEVTPGDTVVISGEVGHAPSLHFALGALCAGAAVRFVDRKALLAVLSDAPVDHLCTTPPVLRRALYQLERRQRPVAGVGRTVLHQGLWRPHEKDRWPARLAGSVEARISATEAGGWVVRRGRPAPGISVRVLPDERRVGAAEGGAPPRGIRHALEGRLFLNGPATATAGPEGIRPGGGWDSGDLAGIDEAGRLHWQRRVRDHFEADGGPVDPLEVEAVLGSHPLVAEVVVAPRPYPGAGNIVVAMVVPTDPEWPPFVEDLSEVSAALAPHSRVRALAIADDVPLNAAGAIHRRLVNYEEAGR